MSHGFAENDHRSPRLRHGRSALRCIATAMASLLFGTLCLNAHEPPPASRFPQTSSNSPGSKPAGPTCSLALELIDAKTGEPLPGIVQVLDAAGKGLELAVLVNRGQGIEERGPIHRWWVSPKRTTITVPAAPLTIKAVAGLETELATVHSDLTGKSWALVRVPLVRFAHARRDGYVAGNTHLHLMKLSKPQADRYLREVPLADGLDIVFLSYLERAVADLEYTSNKYTPADLERLAHEHVRFGHGEEHRHNFGSHDEGYGHILLLDIPLIVQPVSIGPGITKKGPDSPPLQQGIDEARKAGGKVIWAHNSFGFEDIPNWLTDRVHANNIFDGGSHGSYKNTYYRYLNVGLHVPFSSGTDWFIYDFSRAYVMADRSLTPKEWLDRLAAGKSYITNGPLLEFTVDDRPLGSVLELTKPGDVAIRGRCTGRLDFKRIELMQDGQVVRTVASRKEGEHFVAQLNTKLSIDSPAWLALRTPPPPVKDDAELQEPVAENELGGPLFAHTSPIYVNLAGRGVFDRATAEGLVAQMKADLEKIQTQAVFDNETQRQRVAHVYQEAIEVLGTRLRP